ncbi:SUKH superfamily protein [Mucilaginibacter oryzae]|uniref:SUKH superfamily protein n=1 Tax=Mucilaginibacter oryzae TaxID=468058 RepID=A0A316HAN6_9SPHI|nr:SMI1/KNR4 family protein [Mucilaginibacter oryzae]PWK77536.1 SUKH superfamily protein [Mucilaginibacter oryzae]
MKYILKEISRLAIPEDRWNLLTDEQIQTEWLGKPPASENEIKAAEDRLGVAFPADYKDFLLIANGFSAPNDIEPGFEPADRVDFLKNIDPFLVEIWNETELDERVDLERSIVVAGIDAEQYFLLVPPLPGAVNWKYLKFANWIPGSIYYENLEAYFRNVLHFMQKHSK